jgi:hypothetical protein
MKIVLLAMKVNALLALMVIILMMLMHVLLVQETVRSVLMIKSA